MRSNEVKILVISHMYPSSAKEVNGIFVHQQVKELQRQGCEVRVVSPRAWTPFPVKYLSRKWKRNSLIPEEVSWDGVEVYYPRYLVFPRAAFFASSGNRMYLGISKLIRKIQKDFAFDIIHAHVALPDGFAAMMLKRTYKKPLVITIHGQDLQVTLYRNENCRKALIKASIGADKVVTVSTKLHKVAKANLDCHEKIIVISNGINPSEVAVKKGNLSARYAGYKIILSVSHLNVTKGIDLNIKAMSKLVEKYPNLRYLVIGTGPELQYLKKLTHDLNLKEQIEFIGQLSHDKVMEYMAIADIFSLPSWNEAFGVVYTEAMMNGKPVIACQGEGITDVIQNGKNGLLVKPKTVDSLVHAIEYLLENSEKAQEIGIQAKKLVLENYTWEKNAKKYMETYKELLT